MKKTFCAVILAAVLVFAGSQLANSTEQPCPVNKPCPATEKPCPKPCPCKKTVKPCPATTKAKPCPTKTTAKPCPCDCIKVKKKKHEMKHEAQKKD